MWGMVGGGVEGYFAGVEGEEGAVVAAKEQVAVAVYGFRPSSHQFRAPLDLDALADGFEATAPLRDWGDAVSEVYVEVVQFVKEAEEQGAHIYFVAGFEA